MNTYVYTYQNPIINTDPLGFSGSIGFGGNAPLKGPAGGGGEAGITEIICCKNGKKVKQRYAYFEAGPSIGASAVAGVNVTINILSKGETPTCEKPTPSLWRIEVLIFSISESGIDVGMRLDLAARWNMFSGYTFIDQFVTDECC